MGTSRLFCLHQSVRSAFRSHQSLPTPYSSNSGISVGKKDGLADRRGRQYPIPKAGVGRRSSNPRRAPGGSTTNFDHFAPKDRCRSSPLYNPITTVSPGEKDGLAEKRTTALDTEGISSSIRDPRLITSISGVPLPTLSTLVNRGRPGPLEIRIRPFRSAQSAILPIDRIHSLTRSLSSYQCPPLPDNARPTLYSEPGRINSIYRAITPVFQNPNLVVLVD